MSKRYAILLILVFSLIITFFVAISHSNATGMPVFDAANFMQNQVNYADQIRNTINSFTMLQNQMTQIAYEIQNLKKMDDKLSASNMANLQRSLSTMINLCQNVVGIALNYEQSQSAWDRTYPKFNKYNGMSGSDYSKQSETIRYQTSNAIYDAMTAQGLVAQLGNDAANLNTLLATSSSTDGVLAAIQVGNQIAALQVQQLMRLQMIMASSYRAETSYYAEEVQGKAAASANANKLKLNTRNTLNAGGNGDGTPGF